MTYTDMVEELERNPFVPLRFHFVSGKTLDIRNAGSAWKMRRAVLVLQENRDRKRSGMYDMIDPRAVERIEQLLI